MNGEDRDSKGKIAVNGEDRDNKGKIAVNGNEGRGRIHGEQRTGKKENHSRTSMLNGTGLKGISVPNVEGEVVLNRQPLSFFGDFDLETGVCINPGHDLVERSIAGKILVYPSGAGSTVGTYSLVNMVLNDAGPKAILVNSSDPVIVLGCCVADIPHIHGFKKDITVSLKDGMRVKVDGERGFVEIMG